MPWKYLAVGGTEMGRNGSDNSTTSLSQGSDLSQYSPSSPRTPMSFDPASAYTATSPFSSVSYAPDPLVPQHAVTVRTDQDQPLVEKPTPTSLHWSPNTELVKLYKLIIVKGFEPYLELLPQYSATPDTPQIVNLDSPKEHAKGLYRCQYPGICPGSGKFKRLADLDRHYKNVHDAATESFACDYLRCTRSSEPFTRKDHYRDHLRDFHKEDLGSYKRPKDENWPEKQREWLSERRLSPNWWRCSRCLIRVQVKEHGYQCPTCKSPCDESRIKHREEKHRSNTASASNPQWDVPTMSFQPSVCISCEGSGWVTTTTSELEPCPSCQRVQQYPYEQGIWGGTTYNIN
ncbi:hypothetical protein B7463_g5364, partial [Scytalidium lignicola]